MTKFESMHEFNVPQTGPTGIRFEETLAVPHGLLAALFALSYLMDEGGYRTHKVMAIKLLRKYVQMHDRDLGLLEAKGVIETIWEKFEYSGEEVVHREEPFSVTYKGVYE